MPKKPDFCPAGRATDVWRHDGFDNLHLCRSAICCLLRPALQVKRGDHDLVEFLRLLPCR
jgi:hypothetical protein